MAMFAFLWWFLAILAQVTAAPALSAASALFHEPVTWLFFMAIQIVVVSRQMSSWRRQRPRLRCRKPQHCLSHITSPCARASMLIIRTVITFWLVLVCSGTCINFAASALDLSSVGPALHSELNVIALRSIASPASRQLPDLGFQSRFAAFASRILPEHPAVQFTPAFTHHAHFDINVTNSSSRCTSAFPVAFSHHLQSRQPWLAAAHSIVTPASALHAPAVLNSTTSSCSISTAFHLAAVPQGLQSAFCAIPSYASASTCPTEAQLLPPSLSFYRLSSRGGRLSALQRFGAAAEGASQLVWRFALQLSSWGGGARITLAAAYDRAGRFGASVHMLWRQVRAECTVSPSKCMYSSGATVLELGGGGGRLGRCLCVPVVFVLCTPVDLCCCCQ
jgi:hypothetical protein